MWSTIIECTLILIMFLIDCMLVGYVEAHDQWFYCLVLVIYAMDHYLCLQDGNDAENSKQSTSDMTAFVQNLLQQMQTRFQTMSDSIIVMGNRIDELEQSINDLRTEMGQEGYLSPPAQLKSKEEPRSADDG
ncbi:hypothetical protein OROGR_025326 [Orobanche gracilis]